MAIPRRPPLSSATGAIEERAAALRGADPGPASRLLPTQPGGDAWQGQRVVLPFDHFPPATMVAIDVVADLDAFAGSAVNSPIVTIDVPPGQRLRIAGVGWSGDTPISMTTLLWRIQTTSGVLPGFDNMPAGMGTLSNPVQVIAIVPGPNQVQVVAFNSNAAFGVHYVCRVVGWLYSNQLDPLGR